MTRDEQHVLAVTTAIATLKWIERESYGLSRPSWAPMVYIGYAYQDAIDLAEQAKPADEPALEDTVDNFLDALWEVADGDFDDNKPWHHN